MAPKARLGHGEEERKRMQSTARGDDPMVRIEAAYDAGDGAVENEVAGHELCSILLRRQQLGDGRRARTQSHVLEMGAVLGRHLPGEHAGVRRQRPAFGGIGAPEVHGFVRELLEERRRWTAASMRGERTRAQRIDDDQDDVHGRRPPLYAACAIARKESTSAAHTATCCLRVDERTSLTPNVVDSLHDREIYRSRSSCAPPRPGQKKRQGRRGGGVVSREPCLGMVRVAGRGAARYLSRRRTFR